MSFATFAAYMVLSAQPTMHMDGEAYKIASLAQWFPLVYTAAFFFLDTRRATLVSGFVYVSIVIPCFVDLSLDDSVWWISGRGILLINMFCSHPVYIVVLSGIAKLKAHVVQAHVNANELRIAASIDYLTGVANRRAIVHTLENALDHAHKRRAKVSVILLDIDHFKLINDTFGHNVGDNVLIQVASLLNEHLRASDELGRWGGEEFVIVADATDATEAARLAERLRALVAGHRFEPVGQLTASFGVAVSLPHDTTAMLVKRADQALYQAKQLGRNRVEVASELISGPSAPPSPSASRPQ
ncbi:MAG: GGDEF domain-containing protein [Chloroflexales bacterium]|nr:GGDEF domain-containing protein [Chloroflexales bacterium]